MNESASSSPPSKWKPLSATDRRVLGVLVEKAKTTPEAYPLTLNALRTGANQKSNRFPQMQLDQDQVEDALERLRAVEAVTEIVSDGRVPKYRHRGYDWLGVDKVEMAVMAELLLRGAQTVGELRGRAARMEPISDMNALQPILQSLQAKNLILYLSPPGRGAVVTHNLYQPSELDRLRREYGTSATADPGAAQSVSAEPAPAPAPAAVAAAGTLETTAPPAPQPTRPAASSPAETEALRHEVSALRAQLGELREQLEATTEQLQSGLDDIRQQLGI